MNRTETYSGGKERGRMAQDLDTWVGNSLATILAALAIVAGVIGLLVAFEYINDGAANPFQDGMVWMISGIILAISANVFRREHHVVETDRSMGTRPLQGGAERDVDYERSSKVDEPRSGSGMRSDIDRDDPLGHEHRRR